MAELFANSEDPDQTPRSATSDQGFYCLIGTRLRVSSLQWGNTRMQTRENTYREKQEATWAAIEEDNHNHASK